MTANIGQLFQTVESLADHGRLLPAVAVLDDARRRTPDRQLYALATYNMGAIYWHRLGNGLAARREFLEAIECFDSHGYGDKPNLKTIHANALENAMLNSLSFDEFEDLGRRLEALQPGLPILIGLIPEVRNWRQRGDSWADRLFAMAETYYNRNDARRDVGRYGEGRATHHLILAFRRDLRVHRELRRMALIEYCALSMRMAADCMHTRGLDNDRNPPDEFLPILTETLPYFDEYLHTNSGDDELRELRRKVAFMVDNYRQRWAELK